MSCSVPQTCMCCSVPQTVQLFFLITVPFPLDKEVLWWNPCRNARHYQKELGCMRSAILSHGRGGGKSVSKKSVQSENVYLEVIKNLNVIRCFKAKVFEEKRKLNLNFLVSEWCKWGIIISRAAYTFRKKPRYTQSHSDMYTNILSGNLW